MLRERRASLPASAKIQITDFELVKKIGQGGYGEVYLCRKKDTNETLALKIMEKSLIWTTNKKKQVKNERDVLAQGSHDHLVRLHYSFQDPHYLYLAMEYCPGGDLYHLVETLGGLEEGESRLYIAEMVLAIHSLHKLGYIHRDLKPDNFLIDSKGHIKLADFGLSKDGLSQFAESPHGNRCPSNTLHAPKRKGVHSVVGSPDYMAPEVLSNFPTGYGKEIDWWSLGCLIFEMRYGVPPFNATTPKEVFDNILNWKRTLPIAIAQVKEFISENFLSLILGFLCEPEKRLGGDVEVLKKHPFFDSLDWDNLRSQPPLFVPVLENEFDVSYFDLPSTPSPDRIAVKFIENATPQPHLHKTSLLRDKEKLSNPLRIQLERLHRTRSLDWSVSNHITPSKEKKNPKTEKRGPVLMFEKRTSTLWSITPPKDSAETPPSEKQILGFTFQRRQITRVVELDKQKLPTFKLTEPFEEATPPVEDDLMSN